MYSMFIVRSLAEQFHEGLFDIAIVQQSYARVAFSFMSRVLF